CNNNERYQELINTRPSIPARRPISQISYQIEASVKNIHTTSSPDQRRRPYCGLFAATTTSVCEYKKITSIQ
ncbi:hypothetical protein M8C21_023458, partial [Ambrosia artemisiifolia]